MPKRTDISSILIIGAGPIIIGQACEFDYSGAQACKALKEAGYRVILVNSNPATIMTDPLLADATYIEPIHWENIEKIIEKEKPDAILPTMGGQTALNLAMEAEKKGILKKYSIELIGANSKAISNAEDRKKFRKNMIEIGLDLPKSKIVNNFKQSFFAGLFILISAINQGINSGILPVYYSSTLNWQSDTYSQISGGPGAILEFFGAIIGGVLADRFGRRKVFFLGWGSFSVLSGVFGLMVLTTHQLPYWFQVFYLIVYPFFIAIGTVSMFALAMALSWSKASATMFTSYMAVSYTHLTLPTKA